MVRSAAKNWQRRRGADRRVAVRRRRRRAEARRRVSSETTRFALAVAAFNRIANYDAAISDYLSSLAGPSDGVPERAEFPAQANGRFVKLQDLRYGENPHQSAAFYRDLQPGARLAGHGQAAAGQGALVQQHRRRRRGVGVRQELRRAPACVIVKHANPCGVAIGGDARRGLRARRCKTDPTSAFGGIIAFNREVDRRLRRARRQAVRRGADRAVVQRRGARGVRREEERARPADRPAGRTPAPAATAHDIKRVGSGLLIQTADNHEVEPADLKVVTTRKPDAASRCATCCSPGRSRST